MIGFVQSVYFGDESGSSHKISVDDLRARISKVIEEENAVLQQQCEKNGLHCLRRRFAEPNTLEVLDGKVRCGSASKLTSFTSTPAPDRSALPLASSLTWAPACGRALPTIS